MQGYSVKLPIKKDKAEGFLMNRTLAETIKQDFKMLMLTNPGERMMMPDYGVGLRELLFSQNSNNLIAEVKKRIIDQVSRYMNFIRIADIQVNTSEINENMFNVLVRYEIPSLRSLEEINLSLSSI